MVEPNAELESCTVVERGNVHDDIAAALDAAIRTAPVEGTSFTFGMRQDDAGTGPTVDDAVLATFHYQLYESEAFTRAASCDLCSGTLTLDVSAEGSLGRGVQAALRSGTRRDSSGMALGGWRAVIVREEIAQGLREHLPAMPREAQICIELSLVDLE